MRGQHGVRGQQEASFYLDPSQYSGPGGEHSLLRPGPGPQRLQTPGDLLAHAHQVIADNQGLALVAPQLFHDPTVELIEECQALH